VDWSGESRSLVCLLAAAPPEESSSPANHHVLTLLHAGTEARHFTLPTLARDIAWRLFVNTAAESPDDVYPTLDGPPPASNGVVTLEPRSLLIYVAPDEGAR
jgi:glycogen operon protein